MDKTITIHGREGFSALVMSIVGGEPVDLSGATIYFEAPAAKLRLLLPVDPVDAKSVRLTLTRAQVETLPTVPSPFTIIDETGLPTVIEQGTIVRTGYKGEPK